jgi:hypothetical protein
LLDGDATAKPRWSAADSASYLLPMIDVEALCSDLVAAGVIERAWMQ